MRAPARSRQLFHSDIRWPANGGAWTVVSITATDGAGNSATYTPPQIDVVRDGFEYTWLTYEFFP